jgi:hypothetical protein
LTFSKDLIPETELEEYWMVACGEVASVMYVEDWRVKPR